MLSLGNLNEPRRHEGHFLRKGRQELPRIRSSGAGRGREGHGRGDSVRSEAEEKEEMEVGGGPRVLTERGKGLILTLGVLGCHQNGPSTTCKLRGTE